jgi:hypothetical protein
LLVDLILSDNVSGLFHIIWKLKERADGDWNLINFESGEVMCAHRFLFLPPPVSLLLERNVAIP